MIDAEDRSKKGCFSIGGWGSGVQLGVFGDFLHSFARHRLGNQSDNRAAPEVTDRSCSRLGARQGVRTGQIPDSPERGDSVEIRPERRTKQRAQVRGAAPGGKNRRGRRGCAWVSDR